MNKNTILFILILALVVLVGAVAYFAANKTTEAPAVVIDSFDLCVASGYPVMESYPRQCRTPDGKNLAEDIGNEIEKTDMIKIDNPRPNQTVQSPLLIEGEARGNWYFEASFPIKLFDDDGNLLVIGIAQAQSDWMATDFVPFKVELNFAHPATREGTLVLKKNNPSGLPEHADELRVPVKFIQSPSEMMKVKVYFNNSELDPEFSCNKVFAVEREVPRTQTVARAALNELLKGTTQNETNEGFFTSLNTGVNIQSLTIENGTAKIDFDDRLEFQVGGSCRVSTIRTQITETLTQFPTVDNVIISINGRTEDILQP